MKKLLLLTLPIFLYGGVFDFWHIKQANKAYKEKNYPKAITEYQKLESDEARYNLSNSYYRLGEYEKAIQTLSTIKSKKLEFQKLHNLGNCYAQSGKIKEAIKAYEEALKIKEDKDTRYNLELLKKRQKQQKNSHNKNKDKKQKNKQKQNQDKNKQSDKGSKKSKQNSSDKNKQEKDKKNHSKQKEKNKQSKNNQQNTKNQKPKPQLSDMQERKYLKMLNKKGVNTLLLPLKKKGAKNHEENPW